MDVLTALLVILALPVLIHLLLVVALEAADRRAGAGRAAAPAPDGGTSYLEVGAWSGRTYPRGAVVVGYSGKQHSRLAVRWAAHEAARRERPLVVLYAADYPGMTRPPGAGLYYRDPGALDAAEELTASGVAEAMAAAPGLDVVGATEVTSPGWALAEASRDASLVVVGSRGRQGVIGALRRSVGSQVARAAHAPVVVVGGERSGTEDGGAGARGTAVLDVRSKAERDSRRP